VLAKKRYYLNALNRLWIADRPEALRFAGGSAGGDREDVKSTFTRTRWLKRLGCGQGARRLRKRKEETPQKLVGGGWGGKGNLSIFKNLKAFNINYIPQILDDQRRVGAPRASRFGRGGCGKGHGCP